MLWAGGWSKRAREQESEGRRSERAREEKRKKARWDGVRDRVKRERATERVRVDRTVEGRARASIGAREDAMKELD